MNPTLRALHLDDDPFELERVERALAKSAVGCAFVVESVGAPSDFRARLAQQPAPDVIILDINVGDAEATGVKLAAEARRIVPQCVILMCSTADDVATIAECLNGGADDFISKHSDGGELSLRVVSSYRLAILKRGVTQGRNQSPRDSSHVGATMERVHRRIPQIIQSAITSVFIRGASGTGKEVVVDLFGSALPSGTPLIKINCGAIAPTLLESELFGHAKGAFTGAITERRGLLEAASHGFLFLDEVATLSASAQTALLRALESQEVLRVGSTKPVAINIRILAATNEPIEELVKQGKFRGDLWQRLCEAEIELPPLAERPDEIKPLVEHFCKTMRGGPYKVSAPVMEILSSVAWREGNVRELRNCLRAMTEMHVDKLLTPLSIPSRIWDELGDTRIDVAPTPRDTKTLSIPFDPETARNYDDLADHLLLELARSLSDGAKRHSLRGLAQAIGMSRSTLSGRLKALIRRGIADLPTVAKIVNVAET